ncbi:ABC transporter substrate-binding protein [Maridesulfovibrio zosterae]|uniref:ABC transporter substrate-binding protein n=1 Tax=Maridesulfovibrio zosterae TaxID=82171 RepID=UPI0003FBE647|nr:ABC transporter substrate-binding protein [Maridesulfovibrio zosterae]
MTKILSAISMFLLLCTSSFADQLVLGTIFETKGDIAPTAQEAMNGAVLAVKKINASSGKIKIDLKTEAITSGPEDVLKAVDKFSVLKSISAVSGILSSDPALSAAPALQANGLPFLCTGAEVAELSSVGPKIFTLAVPGKRIGQIIARYTGNTLQIGNIILISSDLSDTDARQAESFAKYFRQNNGNIMAEMRITENDADLSFIVKKINQLTPPPPENNTVTNEETGTGTAGGAEADIIIQKRDPAPAQPEIEAIVIFTPPRISLKLLELFNENSITYQIIGGTSFDRISMQQSIKNWPGILFYAAQASLQREDQLVQEFVQDYKNLFGNKPSTGNAALGFDSIMLLAEAAQKEGSQPAEIIKGLSGIDNFYGVSGKISFQDRSAHKPLYIIKAHAGKTSLATEFN